MAKPKIYQIDQLQNTFSTMNTATTSAFNQANSAYSAANTGGGPKIASIIYPGDDTAANNIGGQTVYLTGSGFYSNSSIYINGNSVPATSFISASNIGFTTPNLTNGIYPIYLVNYDGATAIKVPGIVISGEPSWNTAAGSLSATQDAASAWSYSLSANGDTPITYSLAAGSSLPTGVSLNANGVISGTISSPPGVETTYTFSVVASDAQNQDATRQFSVTATVGDANFRYTTLLIDANGTNAGNNHTFIDSSNNNFAITRYGNATQGSFSPFSKTGWSNYFDGSGYSNYLTKTGSLAPFQFGTGDFTVEAWIYITGNSAPDPGNNRYAEIVGYSNSSVTDGGWLFQVTGDTTTTGTGLTFQHWYAGSSSTSVSVTTSISQHTWHHVAVVRSGTTTSLYLNGTRVQTGTLSDQNIVLGDTLGIAMRPWPNNYKFPFYGYISNLRIVKGTAVYTGASYTVPTAQLTAISGTSLLTCQSNRFIDNSTNNYALTVNGTPSVQSFSPFAPTAAYTTANVGGSMYLDGNGDYTNITDSSNLLDLGGAAASVEAWFYPNGTGTYVIFCKFGSSPDWSTSTGFEWQIQFVSGVFNFYYNSAGTPTNLTDSVARPANQWYHIAVATNASNAISLYINGTRVATATNAITKPTSRTNVRLGQDLNGNYYVGYVSGVRIITGANAYDATQSSITVPTLPPTNVAGTQLLYNFTNAQIINQTSKTNFETVGTAKVSTSIYKYGTGSIDFSSSANDSYLITDTTRYHEFGTGDFTIEGWIYPTSLTTSSYCDGNATLFDLDSPSGTGTDWWVVHQVNAGFVFATNAAVVAQSTTGLTANQWSHFAITRSGSTVRIFTNGTISNTATYSTTVGGNRKLSIGKQIGQNRFFKGYLDDLRITKGYARYTANTSAPSGAFPNR